MHKQIYRKMFIGGATFPVFLWVLEEPSKEGVDEGSAQMNYWVNRFCTRALSPNEKTTVPEILMNLYYLVENVFTKIQTGQEPNDTIYNFDFHNFKEKEIDEIIKHCEIGVNFLEIGKTILEAYKQDAVKYSLNSQVAFKITKSIFDSLIDQLKDSYNFEYNIRWNTEYLDNLPLFQGDSCSSDLN